MPDLGPVSGALLIFKKDVRRFRLQLCAYLGLMALFAWMETLSPRRLELHQAASFCEILLLLAAWYLTVMVQHQETLPGDQQYWLTRPISWKSLLLAKILFVVVFFHVPLLAANLSALLANGLSPLASAWPLLAKQAFLAGYLVLPAMALAAVTRNFGQFAIWVFAAFAAVLVIGLGSGDVSPGHAWGAFFWMVESAIGIVSVLTMTGLLLWQYARRTTAQSQIVFGAVLLICAAAPAMNLWHAAFALQSRWAGHQTEASAIQLVFDAAHDLAPGRGVVGTRPGTESMARFVLPVRVTGIPAGREVVRERIAVTVDAPGGATWRSGWTAFAEPLRPTADDLLLTGDGAYWQYIYIDRDFFERTRNAPVHLRTESAFTLLSQARTARLTPPAVAQTVPDFGFCTARSGAGGISNTIGGFMSVFCLAPFQPADWVLIRTQSRRTGQFQTSGTRQEISYSPYPTDVSGGLWTLVGAAMLVVDSSDLDFVLEARHAEAHFERALDIPAIRLDQYRDAPPGGFR